MPTLGVHRRLSRSRTRDLTELELLERQLRVALANSQCRSAVQSLRTLPVTQEVAGSSLAKFAHSWAQLRDGPSEAERVCVLTGEGGRQIYPQVATLLGPNKRAHMP